MSKVFFLFVRDNRWTGTNLLENDEIKFLLGIRLANQKRECQKKKETKNKKILINTVVRTTVGGARHWIVKEKISGEKYKGKTRENEVVNLYIRIDWKRYLKKIKKI